MKYNSIMASRNIQNVTLHKEDYNIFMIINVRSVTCFRYDDSCKYKQQ